MSLSLTKAGETTGVQVLAKLPKHVAEPDPKLYWSDNYIVLDFETTAIMKGSPLHDGNRIILAVWQGEDRKVHCKRASEYELGSLVRAVEAASFIVAHNAKFELGWLSRCGVDLRKIVCYDTMIGEYVLGSNRYHPSQLSLSSSLARYSLGSKGDTVSKMIGAGVPVENIPENWLLNYCIRDVEATHDLFIAQRAKLRDKNLEAVNYQRNLVTPALAAIEFNGLQLDKDKVLQLEQEQEVEYARLSNKLQTFCEGSSPTSPKQMREFIFGKLGFRVPKDYRGQLMLTPTGEPSVSAAVMERLSASTRRQKRFIELRAEWVRSHADLTKCLRKFGTCVRENGGILRANFNQTNTRTHRLSSTGLGVSSVQFQNLNRAFKPLFKPRRDGWMMGEADGSQLEFRVAVHLGRDSVGLRDIVGGRDAHQYTADVIGVSRQEAKAHTFKPLYGGTSGTKPQREYYQKFQRRYSSIYKEQLKWTQEVLRDKKLRTEWGMTYYWPDTKSTETGYITNSTSIFNYPVQACATAEIIPISLVCMWHLVKNMNSFIVNTVHDSIISEVHPDEVEEYRVLSKLCLTEIPYYLMNRLYGVKLTVPLGSEVVLGSHWGVKDDVIEYMAQENLWKSAANSAGMLVNT